MVLRSRSIAARARFSALNATWSALSPDRAHSSPRLCTDSRVALIRASNKVSEAAEPRAWSPRLSTCLAATAMDAVSSAASRSTLSMDRSS
jgi:hypothetical protein